MFITGSNADLRKANSPLRSPLIKDFRVLNYDQRGMGQSDKPDHPYSMLDYAEDAIAILDKLGWNETLLAGYSFGGMVAQEIAIRWPSRISRLALMATTAGGDGGSSYPIQEFKTLPAFEAAHRSLEVADLSFTPAWQSANPEKARTRIKQRQASQTMFMDEPLAKMGIERQLKARSEHNTYSRLHMITCPTLVLAGNKDGQAPIAAQQAMADRIPNSTIHVVEGSHGMLRENMQTFEHLIRFMKE